jgi:hypothetical protein
MSVSRRNFLMGAAAAALAPSLPALPAPAAAETGFEAYQAALLRNVGKAMGMSADQLSANWSAATYSGARAHLLEAWKVMDRRRSYMIAQLDFETVGGIPAHAFMVPARGWVDPVRR